MQKGIADGDHLLVFTWGMLHPALPSSPFLTQTLRPAGPPALCQSCTASAPMLVLSLFPLFFQAVSECMEQQGPTQVLGAPRSPLNHCVLPKGSLQALVHVGTPQLSSVALEQGSSGMLCWALCHPWLPFKKLGGKLQNPEACSCHAQISLTSGAVGGTSPTQEGAQVVYAKNWAAEEIIKTLRAPQLLCFVSASVQRQGSYIPKM